MSEKQLNYDLQANLPIIEGMLKDNAKITKDVSEKLVNIGDETILVSKTLAETNEQLESNGKHLQDILSEQSSIVKELYKLSDNLTTERIDTKAVDQLKNDFVEKLNNTIDEHKGDKDAIIEQVNKVYGEYSAKIDKLTGDVKSLNELLSDKTNFEQIQKLSEQLVKTEKLIGDYKEQQAKDVAKQFEHVDELLTRLSEASSTFDALIKNTKDNQDIVNKLLSRTSIIENRLDVLLQYNEGAKGE